VLKISEKLQVKLEVQKTLESFAGFWGKLGCLKNGLHGLEMHGSKAISREQRNGAKLWQIIWMEENHLRKLLKWLMTNLNDLVNNL
jgi:hypothetical protein